MIYLNPDFEAEWAGRDPFEEAFRLDGEIFRAVKARRTFRFELNGKSYFAKVHRGVGWREIFKNLLQFKLPVLGAANEYEAIRRLEELGVATMTPVAFGTRGKNPAKIESFILTEELVNTISLEDYCCPWNENPPPVRLKRALIRYVAEASRKLHRNGVNHRDYYICHFLLDLSPGCFTEPCREVLNWSDRIKASIIDLHRAQLRKKTPRRWIIKDLASLYFSAMDIGLSGRDLLLFMSVYSNTSIRQVASQDRFFWGAVVRAARRLYAKEQIRPKG